MYLQITYLPTSVTPVLESQPMEQNVQAAHIWMWMGQVSNLKKKSFNNSVT
jgi:hypothetical protein